MTCEKPIDSFLLGMLLGGVLLLCAVWAYYESGTLVRLLAPGEDLPAR